ncbi:MAG: Fic family protein, partial [Acidaminobacteraceae bacterium]
IELSNDNVSGRFGRTHLINVHKYIFQDIYPFAGKIRTEDIWKGTTFFCKYEHIGTQLDELLSKLVKENLLKECSDDEFIQRIVYYMSELNIIHPFREGNGRAIREFIRSLALQSGRIVNWHYVNSKMLINASIQAVDFNYELLEQCVRDSLKNKI